MSKCHIVGNLVPAQIMTKCQEMTKVHPNLFILRIHLECFKISLIGGCIGSSESIHVKMPHCWKSHTGSNHDQVSEDRKSGLTKVHPNLFLMRIHTHSV